MSKIVTVSVVTILMNLLSGCSEKSVQVTESNNAALQNSGIEASENSCNQAWFEKVDQQVITSDGQGHGPDIGSMEWRSVVEFKLGIRGDESNPKLDSEQWCNYIDKHFIK